jgi:hypothetical protein
LRFSGGPEGTMKAAAANKGTARQSTVPVSRPTPQLLVLSSFVRPCEAGDAGANGQGLTERGGAPQHIPGHGTAAHIIEEITAPAMMGGRDAGKRIPDVQRPADPTQV